MKLYRIGFVLAALSFLSPAFASVCPTADAARHCSGDQCVYPQFPGWSRNAFYMDQGKPFTFLKVSTQNTERGKEISCYYTYLNPETHQEMPPALMLRTVIE
jgi:hypothetical protein